MKKECNVVMLATDKQANLNDICFISDGITRRLSKINGFGVNLHNNSKDSLYSLQHLYITSDEKIKEDDWYYSTINKKIRQATKNDVKQMKHSSDAGFPIDRFKIIATTDTSLLELTDREIDGFSGHIPLPQIPQSFIDIFITEYNKETEERFEDDLNPAISYYYNKNNVIDKVMVDYDWINRKRNQSNDEREYSIRINPDNTINISLIEEEKKYSRSEVIKIINEISMLIDSDEISNDVELNEYIEENLK